MTEQTTSLSMEKTAVVEQEEIASLVERIKDGDRQAFMEVVSLYQKKLFLLAFTYFKNRDDALDIVQETFLRFYQKVDMFQKGKNFQAWLLQIAKNLCIDYYRKNYSKRQELEGDKSLDELPLAADPGESSEQAADLKDIFVRCLEKLGERQRMIFAMRHYNGLQYGEIAKILGISIGTVKSLHFKAVQNLKGLMGPYLGYENETM